MIVGELLADTQTHTSRDIQYTDTHIYTYIILIITHRAKASFSFFIKSSPACSINNYFPI